MPQVSQIQSKGIYLGLPTFPDTHEGYTAVVAGANGISGHHMVENPQTIYFIGR